MSTTAFVTRTGSRHSGRRHGCASCVSCSPHPDGLVVGDIQAELDIPNSTLSHHLEKLRHEDLVTVRREGTFLRYAADTETLAELLGFLYAECCTRNRAVNPREIVWTGKQPRKD